MRYLRRLRSSKGNSMIEAAIILPLLTLLTLGLVEFASVFWVYLALENGVSQASRFAVTGNFMDDPDNPGTPLSREQSIRAAFRKSTTTLTVDDAAFSFYHMPPGGAGWVGGTGGPNDIEKVTVQYTWEFWTPMIRPFFTNGEITLSVDSMMKNEGRFE